MSKSYPNLDRTKFPDATDAFILFEDPNDSVRALLSEYETKLAAHKYSEAATFLSKNAQKLSPYVINADRLNHILHALMAMQQFYMSDVQEAIADIVTWRGVYSGSTTYNKFDVVTSGAGSIIAYMAIADDAFKGKAPPNEDYWVRITLQGQPGTGLTYAGTWNNATTYSTDNWVFYNNVIWVSTTNNNLNHQPSDSSTYWFAIFRNIQHVVCSATTPDNQYPGDLWLKSVNGVHTIKVKQNDGSYSDVFLDTSTIKTSDGKSLADYIASVASSSVSTAVGKITPESIGAATSGHKHSYSDVGAAPASHGHPASAITEGTFPTTNIKAKTGTDYTTARVRNIQFGTADLVEGSSTLASGDMYFVYK